MSQPTPPAGPTTIPDHQNQLHSITLETRNFRALRLTNWTPSGVCVVVGPNGAGKTTLLTLIDPKWNQPCPLALAPDGWITGLLHLTAVAGAPKGSLIAIDDFGNDLHPYAIRKLTEAFREWAEERDL